MDASSVADAASVVEAACNIWGGAYHLLVPVDPGATRITEPWHTLVDDTYPCRTATRDLLPVPPPHQRPDIGGTWVKDSRGDLPLAVLGRMEKPPQGFRTVRVANDLDLDEPWSLAYTATWGRLPSSLDRDVLRWARLREDVTYADVVSIDARPPEEPGAEDLLRSLRDPTLMTAAGMSCVRLGFAAAPVGSQFDRVEPSFPLRYHAARECGPNIVVVYEPGSVVDLCLLWHLRSVHGLREGFPLGLPITADVPAALSHWWQEFAMLSWGLRQTTGHLVSASVAMDSLTALAGAAGPQWSAVAWEEVLQPSWGCGVSSSEVAVFERGRAQLSSVHPAEDAALGRDVLDALGRSLELVATPVGMRLPPSRTLANAHVTEGYRGGAVLRAGGVRDTVALEWPTGLTVLDAVLRDRGVRGEPSEPGRLAETLLRRMSAAGAIEPLMHPAVHQLLERLGARHGMSWFKSRLRGLLHFDSSSEPDLEARLQAVEERVEAMAGEPSDEEQADVTFESVRSIFNDAGAAEAWLAWADEVGLLLRGVQVHCLHCTTRSWRPLAELAPPVVCRGCGTTIEQPYGYNTVKFRFRASELLLRLVKTDALVHALVVRFFGQLFHGSFGRVGPIVGSYPGVTIRRAGDRDPLGEADVLFVMIDGRVGVGECKTRAAGLTEAEVAKLGRLADALDASWTFTATLDRSADCGPLWREHPRDATTPHYALTAEHLFDLVPINVLGSDPLAWRTGYVKIENSEPLSDGEHLEAVVSHLRSWDTWRRKRDVPWWRTEP